MSEAGQLSSNLTTVSIHVSAPMLHIAYSCLHTVHRLQLPGVLKISKVTIDPQSQSVILIEREQLQTDLESHLAINGPFDELKAVSFLLQISTVLSEAETYVTTIPEFEPWSPQSDNSVRPGEQLCSQRTGYEC